jgi:hypothetical protein
MIFPVLAFITVLTSAVLWLFGFMPPDGTIWNVFFSSNSIWDVFKGLLNALWNSGDLFGDLFGIISKFVAGGAIVAGFIYNRDEPIYGGLGVLVFQMLGLYSIFSQSVPVDLKPLLLAVMGLYNFIFVLAFINWVRGKGE